MNEKTVNDLQVGDTCFMFGGHRPDLDGVEMEVVKVGRQYVQCVRKGAADYSTPIQFTRDRGVEKRSIGSTRQIVVDRADYLAAQAARANFNHLRNAMGYVIPDDVTLADIQAAAALLRIDLSKK